MNWDQVEGDWKQVKGKVKEQWGRLTDDELDRLSGKRDQLSEASGKATATNAIALSAKLRRPCEGGNVVAFQVTSAAQSEAGIFQSQPLHP